MISVNTLKGEKRKLTSVSTLIITELKKSGWFLVSSLWFFCISHPPPPPPPAPDPALSSALLGSTEVGEWWELFLTLTLPLRLGWLLAGRGGTQNTWCYGSHRVTLPIQSISKVLWLSGRLLFSKTPWDHRVLSNEETKTREVTQLVQGPKGRTPVALTSSQAGFRQWPQGPK